MESLWRKRFLMTECARNARRCGFIFASLASGLAEVTLLKMCSKASFGPPEACKGVGILDVMAVRSIKEALSEPPFSFSHRGSVQFALPSDAPLCTYEAT